MTRPENNGVLLSYEQLRQDIAKKGHEEREKHTPLKVTAKYCCDVMARNHPLKGRST